MKKSTQPASPQKSKWTFLSNHGHVLLCLHGEPDLPVKDIAVRVGITERAILRILSDLESEGYVKRDRIGRRNQYTIESNKKLRHPIEANSKIKLLLNLV